jgi:hypothetical protein
LKRLNRDDESWTAANSRTRGALERKRTFAACTLYLLGRETGLFDDTGPPRERVDHGTDEMHHDERPCARDAFESDGNESTLRCGECTDESTRQ